MMRTILHIDLNSFYATVEMLYHPEYRNVPMSVCGDAEARHGIILSSNPLAKAKGLKTGEPLWQARKKCPNIIFVTADFNTYMDYSKRVKKLFYEYTDKVESFGIDEAWLDISSKLVDVDGEKIAQEIIERIQFELGLSVSIGISYNKIFAKLGSDLAGRSEFYTIYPNDVESKIHPLPAKCLLYVGQSTEKKLLDLGISTIGDLVAFPLPYLKKHFGKWGIMLYTFSHGLDQSPVKDFQDQPYIKSIGNSCTTPKDCTNFIHIKTVVTILSESVASRLKDHGFMAQTVCISIRNCELESFTRQRHLVNPTDLAEEIIQTAYQLCTENITFDKSIRSIGVSVSDLIHHNQILQLSLFDHPEKTREVEKAMENIRKRFGFQSIKRASMNVDADFKDISPKTDHLIFPQSYFR